MTRGVTAVPTYLITVAVMLVVGVIAASALTGMFLPLAVQKAYMGNAIKYSYTITQGKVVITLANAKDYDAKADVLLITKDGRVSTTCAGYVYSSMNLRKAPPQAKAISLLGITVRPHEIVKIACLNTSVRTVRVVEYGLPSHRQSEAYVGAVGGAGYSVKSSSPIAIGTPYQPADLRYRIPVTVVASKDYGNAYVSLVISPSTVPYDIFRFVMGHVRNDANDVLVVGTDGTRYPTKAVRTYYSLIVTFKVGQLRKGVHRYWLWFGNPDLKKPPYPLKKLGGTPIYTRLPYVAKTSFAYPAYVVPEANWLPFYSPFRYGLIYTESYDTFKKYVNIIETLRNNYEEVKQTIAEALANMTYFPIGTVSTDWHYRDLTPITIFGKAPWATVTVVPLPSFTQYTVAEGTSVTTKVWVASDDGSEAYFINLREGDVVKVEYFNHLYSPHYPRYWNYVAQKRLSASEVSSGSNYLVILQQNGICGCTLWRCRCGNGPGWLDFRYVMWFVQALPEIKPGQGSGGGSGGSGGGAGKVYDFEHDVAKCSKISQWAEKCVISPSNFVYLTYRTSGGIYGAEVTAQKAYSGRKSLHATIGDDRSGFYRKFPAVILFPGPIPKKITFHYYCTGEFHKATGAVLLQGFDGRKWVTIAKLETTGTWLEVTVQNANRYQKIRIYMYVDTSLNGRARLDLYIDHVVYSG